MKRHAMIGALAAALAGVTSLLSSAKRRQPRPPKLPTPVNLVGMDGAKSTAIDRTKMQARRDAKRALLERQSRREKAGVYGGRLSVASMLGQRRGRLCRQRDDATGRLR